MAKDLYLDYPYTLLEEHRPVEDRVKELRRFLRVLGSVTFISLFFATIFFRWTFHQEVLSEDVENLAYDPRLDVSRL
jgi:hypothetical protein